MVDMPWNQNKQPNITLAITLRATSISKRFKVLVQNRKTLWNPKSYKTMPLFYVKILILTKFLKPLEDQHFEAWSKFSLCLFFFFFFFFSFLVVGGFILSQKAEYFGLSAILQLTIILVFRVQGYNIRY